MFSNMSQLLNARTLRNEIPLFFEVKLGFNMYLEDNRFKLPAKTQYVVSFTFNINNLLIVWL